LTIPSALSAAKRGIPSLREGAYIRVLRFVQRLFSSFNVEKVCGVSDVGNLRIGGSGALRRSDAGCEQHHRGAKGVRTLE
jgi:hypothetical protein